MKRQSNPDDNLRESLAQLEGLVCQRTYFNECGTLILYLDLRNAQPKHLTWWRLYIDTSWRVDAGQDVMFGYADPDAEVVRSLRELWNQEIRSIDCNKNSFDLVVCFQNDRVLRVFTNSKKNEQWELRRSDGFRIGIASGLVVNESMAAPDAI